MIAQNQAAVASYDKFYNRYAASLSAHALLLFKRLQLEETAWAAVRARNEIDMSGHAPLAWLRYRSAWGTFAQAAYPHWGRDAAEAWVTMKRGDMLMAFVPRE